MRPALLLLAGTVLLTACSTTEEQVRTACAGTANPQACAAEKRAELADRQREIARDVAEMSRDTAPVGMNLSLYY